MRLVFSILSALPLITSVILMAWFDKHCNTQLVISEKIQTNGATPLRLFELGLRLHFLMTDVCCMIIVIRPVHPVYSFGVSVGITVLSALLSLSSMAAVNAFPRFVEITMGFNGDLVNLGRLYNAVEYLQTTHKCCGLASHNDYKSSELKKFLTIKNKMETFADVPKSCCTMELKGCNLNVFNGVSGRVNRDEGCYKVIFTSAAQCASNLLSSWTMVILFVQAIYLNILTWAHLQFLQNPSFWTFSRLRRCPAFGPGPAKRIKVIASHSQQRSI